MAVPDPLTEPLPDLDALGGVESREPTDPSGELGRVVTGEALVGIEQRVEDRVRGEHRHTACRSLVHHFVGGARTHVVDERIVRGQKLRHVRAPDGVAERDPLNEAEVANERAEYHAMGGIDGFIGDGNLRQGAEGVFEVFYSVNFLKAVWLAGDYQFLWNPGFNSDRGPVNIIGAKIHAEF